jgi:5-methyltetrahydropteroyltriglutamate--homocysteine methyltransferase
LADVVTTVVGSYRQPDWLIDRERLGERLPPRVRARELWRVPELYLQEAQDDATRLAVQNMERAGVDIVTDGEMRRESYSNRFATALDDIDHAETDQITVPGPFTMTQQAQNDHFADDRSLALAYAEAVNEELRDLKAAGADVVQFDEPYLQARPEAAREYAVEAIDRALDGIDGDTVLISLEAAQPNLDPPVLRALPDKTIALGVLDLGSPEAETAELVAERVRRALEAVPPERIVVAPDCGMKYLPRELAFRKLEAMVAGARAA